MLFSRSATAVFPLFLLLVACGSGEAPSADAPKASAESDDVPTVDERYLTERDENDNVDSVAVWHGPDGQHWLLATAKEGNLLQVFDAATGELIRKVGSTGDALGEFRRPNGISIIDDLALVVERDNQRVQLLRLPEFTPLGSFGADELQRPYGLWGQPIADGGYRIFVTDAFETPDEGIPPAAELDRRVQQFRFRVEGDAVEATLERRFGDTEGAGVLYEVESLFGDSEHGRLLVADESEREANIKVYDFGGRFTGTLVGDGVFEYEPEGIALYDCADGGGYWFTTDQDERVNRFHVFDRDSLQHVGSFQGKKTLNTDGIWLSRQPMEGYPQGAFFAVHDDGNAAAFSLAEILDALSLTACGN